jgi:hypothetical protein
MVATKDHRSVLFLLCGCGIRFHDETRYDATEEGSKEERACVLQYNNGMEDDVLGGGGPTDNFVHWDKKWTNWDNIVFLYYDLHHGEPLPKGNLPEIITFTVATGTNATDSEKLSPRRIFLRSGRLDNVYNVYVSLLHKNPMLHHSP